MTLKNQLKEIENLSLDQLQLAHRNLLISFQILSNELTILKEHIHQLESKIIKENDI